MAFRDHPARWTFMINPNCARKLQPVLQETERFLVQRGWIPVVRESELLPFNPPRLMPDAAHDEDGA